MSQPRAIGISAHGPILIVISKENRSRRTRRVDWKCQRAIAIPGKTVVDPCAIRIITNHLVRSVKLIGPAEGHVRDIDGCNGPANADESLKDSGVGKEVAGEVADIVYSEYLGS